MKYVNLAIFFFMVHLCNIQISAASTKHRLKGMDYDIEGFLCELFASRRFLELFEKLSEEAASRIHYNYKKKTFIVDSNIHEAPVYNEKGTRRRSKDKKYDIDGFISQVLASKNVHELMAELTVNAASKIMRFNVNSGLKTTTESNNENPPKTNQVNNAQIKEEITGKIELQAIINKMLSLSENPELKYDDDESDTNKKMQSKEKTNKNDSKKKTIDHKRSRDDAKRPAKGHYGKDDPNRYIEPSHSTDGENQENSKKKYNSREEQGSSHINSREAQNSENKFKGILKQKTSHMDKSREEEKLSSIDKEIHNRPPSEENTNRKDVRKDVAENREKTENRSTKYKKIIVNVGHEDSVKNNKMVSDANPNREVYSSKGSEDSGDRRSPEQSQERSIEDQGGQVKPIIRIEGGKQYTYVQNADYAEYHEKMAEWRKRHPENAKDFI